jgi:PTH1 family peptidyl-tRNA hydrolase
MNRSGAAVRELVASVTVDTARELLVVVDDVALPLGSFRLRARGSAGGHNGLRSIEEALGSQADFVLGPFEQEQLSTLADLLPDLADAAECWLVDGIEEAMNRFNRRGSTE